MTASVSLLCGIWVVILVVIGWIMGIDYANRQHRRQRDQEEQDALLHSIRQDIDSLEREQQRLAARLDSRI